MLVLLDFRNQHAGVGRYGAELIKALQGLEDGPSIVVHGPGVGPLATLARLPFTPWGRTTTAMAARRADADVVHGLHFEIPRTTRPTVVTIQDLIPLRFTESMPNPVRRALFRNLVRVSLERASYVIVPSELTAADVERFGPPGIGKKIVTIPIGVSSRFRPSTEEEVAAARTQFAGGSPYVAAAASPKSHKNLSGLAKAAKLLSGVVPVVCCGWGARLPEPLRYAGPLNDNQLRLFYAGAEVLAMPSFIEGFGLPALEALACGVPVICGENVGALPYIKRGASVVRVEEPREIAKALEMLVNNPATRDSLAREGIRIAATLTLEAEARSTQAVYLGAVETG